MLIEKRREPGEAGMDKAKREATLTGAVPDDE
jgi:hypothetical protein